MSLFYINSAIIKISTKEGLAPACNLSLDHEVLDSDSFLGLFLMIKTEAVIRGVPLYVYLVHGCEHELDSPYLCQFC